MNKRTWGSVAIAVALTGATSAWAVGCSDSDPATPSDAGASSEASSDTGTTPTDAGADTATPQDSGTDASSDASDGGATCGTAAMGILVSIFPSGTPTAGATVAYQGCAATTTAAGGPPASWSLQVSTTPSYFRISLAGQRTTLSAEVNPAVLGAGAIPLQSMGTTLTGYDATKAHVLVSIGAASGACTKNGNTVSLPGHPEATVRYVSASGADVGASTDNAGLAWITDIVPGASPLVAPTVTPAVAGCTLNTTFSTGKVPLVVDTVTVLNAQLQP
ncbi:MAG: hypothetical protein JST00_36365 [Deltaproteobacteria bacterium]|nr:hypothetical protein [Deltaproteobacteria bacterium]